ncbi:MAG: hypothetical protein ACP6IQ_11015 [Candidatus Njordarchaeia archaeon]
MGNSKQLCKYEETIETKEGTGLINTFIEKIYVFNYGSLLAVLELTSNKIRVITNFDTNMLGKSMNLLARLMLAYQDRNSFQFGNYAGMFGREYVVIIKFTKKRFSPAAVGIARRLIKLIDDEGLLEIQIIIERIVKFLIGEKLIEESTPVVFDS